MLFPTLGAKSNEMDLPTQCLADKREKSTLEIYNLERKDAFADKMPIDLLGVSITNY